MFVVKVAAEQLVVPQLRGQSFRMQVSLTALLMYSLFVGHAPGWIRRTLRLIVFLFMRVASVALIWRRDL